MSVRTRRDQVHGPGLALPFWDQSATALLRHADKGLFQRVRINIRKVDIVEVHTADFLQLLLNPAAGFQGVLKATANRFPIIVSAWMEKL
jgi:hypothetical protein